MSEKVPGRMESHATTSQEDLFPKKKEEKSHFLMMPIFWMMPILACTALTNNRREFTSKERCAGHGSGAGGSGRRRRRWGEGVLTAG